jgi:hypothetical protein
MLFHLKLSNKQKMHSHLNSKLDHRHLTVSDSFTSLAHLFWGNTVGKNNNANGRLCLDSLGILVVTAQTAKAIITASSIFAVKLHQT